jgi:hypothetical protein
MKTPTLSNITYTQDNIIKMMHNNQTLIYRYEVRFVLDQRAELDFYSASSLIQQSVDRHVAPLTHFSDS